jgi:hypothetical protein
MVNLLQSARHEILHLRKVNEILEAKVDVINVFAAALGMRQGYQGSSIDVAWELEREIKKLQEPKLEEIATCDPI